MPLKRAKADSHPGGQESLLPKERLLEIYYHLLLTRTVENKVAYICQSQNPQQPLIIGKGYLSTGQEAISVGAAMALEEGDWLAPSHRDIGAHLVRGITLKQIFSQYFCRITSPSRGRDGNVHFGDASKHILSFVSHMGSWLPVANGVAAAMQYKGEKNVVLTFYGDGASSQGVVHESLNYAAVFKLPVVFVINNNQYAISTPLHEQAAVENLALRAVGYGMPGKTIDGNSVLDVYAASKQAVDRARWGAGPSLIECKTLRMAGHGTHDPATYIPKDMVEKWKRKDPVVSFRKYLEQKHLMSEAEEHSIEERIEREIEEAVEWARTQPSPTPEDLPTWL